MSERDSNLDGIAINAPLGLNQRAAPNALPAGEWDKLEGCYPARTGLMERMPGKELLMKLSSPIWNIHQTNDGSGNVLVQTRDALHVFTLDELLGRQGSYSLTYTDGGGETPGEDTTEETMSMAILAQIESNTATGGSLRGIQTGTDATSTAGTWYTRRLTTLLVNESSTIVTQSLSGTSNTNTGSWELAEGSYRITGHFTYSDGGANAGFRCGLYNVTDGDFQPYSGSSGKYLLSTSMRTQAGNDNQMLVIEGAFDVTGGTKEFEIRHKASTNSIACSTSACGRPDNMAGGTVGGAAAEQTYAIIKILKNA